MVENRHKTARNAVKRCKRAKRSGREAKLLVYNRSVSCGCGRSQSAGRSHVMRDRTCSPELPETAPWGLHAQDAGLCSGLLAAVSWSFVFWSSMMLFGSFWLFVFFLCSFIFVCCFLAVFGAFPVILWSFYGRQFLFCGCLFNHRLCLCDAGFCVWWCSVVLFVVILCLLLLFCVFVIISMFLVVVYFFWSDITFVKMPRPLRKYDRPTQHQWSAVMLWCWVWCCVILIVCNIKVTAEWMNVWYQCERLQLLLASLTLTLWPGV